MNKKIIILLFLFSFALFNKNSFGMWPKENRGRQQNPYSYQNNSFSNTKNGNNHFSPEPPYIYKIKPLELVLNVCNSEKKRYLNFLAKQGYNKYTKSLFFSVPLPDVSWIELISNFMNVQALAFPFISKDPTSSKSFPIDGEKYFSKFKNIKILGLGNIENLGEFLNYICKNNDIEQLFLVSSKGLTDSILKSACSNSNSSLRVLHISGSEKLTYDFFNGIWLPELEELLIWYCKNLNNNNKIVRALAQNKKQLPKLKVGQINGVEISFWASKAFKGSH